MNAIHILGSLLLSAAAVTAQCPFSTFSVTMLGGGCNPVVAGVTTPISASASVANCTIQVAPAILLDTGVSPVLRVLVLGLSAASLQVPTL